MAERLLPFSKEGQLVGASKALELRYRALPVDPAFLLVGYRGRSPARPWQQFLRDLQERGLKIAATCPWREGSLNFLIRRGAQRCGSWWSGWHEDGTKERSQGRCFRWHPGKISIGFFWHRGDDHRISRRFQVGGWRWWRLRILPGRKGGILDDGRQTWGGAPHGAGGFHAHETAHLAGADIRVKLRGVRGSFGCAADSPE